MTFDLPVWTWSAWPNVSHCTSSCYMNICTKFYQNPSRHLQEMESWRFDEILSIWPLTSHYDLDLRPAWPNVSLCTLSWCCEHLYQIWSKSVEPFARYRVKTKVWWNTVYMTFDLLVWPWPCAYGIRWVTALTATLSLSKVGCSATFEGSLFHCAMASGQNEYLW